MSSSTLHVQGEPSYGSVPAAESLEREPLFALEPQKGLLHRLADHSPTVDVVLLGCVFLVQFSAFNAMQNLLTGEKHGLALIALGALYVTFAACGFIAPVVVAVLGLKYSIAFGGLWYTLFMFACQSNDPVIFVGAATLCGFGSAVLWTAQGAYLTACSTNENIGKHAGLFWGIMQVNGITGNLLGSLVLVVFQAPFTTVAIIFTVLCGLGNCGALCMKNVQPVDDEPVGDSVLGDYVDATGMKPPRRRRLWHVVWARFLATFTLMAEPKMYLYSAAVLYTGLSPSFFFGVFAGSMGQHLVGFAFAIWGCGEITASLVGGPLSDRIGKRPVLAVGLLFEGLAIVAALLALRIWNPFSDHVYADGRSALFIIAVTLFGVGDSCMNSQSYAVLGTFFRSRSENAFASFKLLQSVGMSAAFFYSPYVTNTFMLTVLTVVLVLAVIGLVVLDQRVAPIDSRESQDCDGEANA